MDQQAERTPKHQQLAPYKWEPGKSGNPKGRPKGSRNKLAEAFCYDVFELWKEHGKGILVEATRRNPVAMCQIVASMMPKDHQLTVEAGPGFRALWEALAAGKVPVVPHDEGADA